MADATETTADRRLPEVGLPLFWPLALAAGLGEAELGLLDRELKFLAEVERTQVERPEPQWAGPSRVVADLHTLRLRAFGPDENAVPTLVLAPYAGHTSVIADFAPGRSLVQTLMANGVRNVHVTDWKSATATMKDYDIDNYLADLAVCMNDLGGRAHLVGLCQGGWLAAMYAARFPAQAASLVLAGAPIDTDAGGSAIAALARRAPMAFFESLVALGGGVLDGDYMLRGFKNLQPERQYVDKYVDLYERVDDPAYLKRFERFERWYERTIDLPGRWYLQVVAQLFRENRFFKGTFVGLGRTLALGAVTCPVYLLAGKDDDITPPAQVFNAAQRLGTPAGAVVQDLAAGGHIGLFMGRAALAQNWPGTARWIAARN
jgi:poly(3-hydroxyalkanoate) synthetase